MIWLLIGGAAVVAAFRLILWSQTFLQGVWYAVLHRIHKLNKLAETEVR